MPITNTFLPGLMPPLICPQNGTICKGKQEVNSLQGKSQALRSGGPDPLENAIRKGEGTGRDTEPGKKKSFTSRGKYTSACTGEPKELFKCPSSSF